MTTTTPQLSRTSVSVSAAYHDDDGPTRWHIDDDGSDLVHIQLYEVQPVGPPFNRDFERCVLSVLLTREQLRELGEAIQGVRG